MQGLEGLGNINTKNDSCTITSPLMTSECSTFVEDKRLLSNDKERFKNLSEYADYLYTWLQNSGVVDVSNGITDWYGFKAIQTVVINDRENQKYMVVGCITLENVQQLILNIENSSPKPSIPTVAICFYDSMYAESQRAKAIDMEVVGNESIREINGAITSSLPYLSIGKRFENKLAKALNDKYRSDNTAVVTTFTSELTETGNSIISSFKEGLNQLVSSVQGAVGICQSVVQNKGLPNTEKEKLKLPDSQVVDKPKDSISVEQDNMMVPEVVIEKSEDTITENRATPGTLDGQSVILNKQQTGEDIVTPGTMDKINQTTYEPAEQGFVVDTTAVVRDSEEKIVVSLDKENNTEE